MTIASSTNGITEVSVRISGLAGSVRNHLRAAVQRETENFRDLMRNEVLSGGVVQTRTGRLKASVHSEMSEGPTSIAGTVGTDVPYAKYLEEGSPAHIIRANAGKVLAFMVGGEMIFRRQVNHPGNKAYHMFGGTLKREAPGIIDRLTLAVKDAENEP